MAHQIEIDYGNYISINIDNIIKLIPKLLPSPYRIKRLRYILVSDDELLKINQDHLKHDFYTDIITFDYSESHLINGEIYISMDRVKENSKGEFIREFIRVVVHGVLHMIGYNDKSEEEKTEMRLMENVWIEKLLVSRET